MNNIDKIFSKDAAAFASAYLSYLGTILGRIDTAEIRQFIETLNDARKRSAMVFFVGNGGSAATASHFANDLVIGLGASGAPVRACALTDNVPIITAIGNDFGYDEIYARQLRVLGTKGDVVVAISASGNSSNLLRVFAAAKEMGIKTVALTAFDGGALRKSADESLHVPTELKEYGPAEDAHMIIDHLVSAYLMRASMAD